MIGADILAFTYFKRIYAYRAKNINDVILL